MDKREHLSRWQLILGQPARAAFGFGLEGGQAACDAALSWLYDRDPELARRDIRAHGRKGGTEAPTLDVPEWINQIHRLFPSQTIERLERDAVERFNIEEVVTNPEVLKRVKPNTSLLQAVLRTRHLMNPQVLELARDLIRKVVEELMEKLAREVRQTFSGRRHRARSTRLPVSRDLDLARTVRANLKHWNPEERRLYLETPYFFLRNRRQRVPWQLILLVDQSGSMAGSVIHSAVTAACLWGVPSLRTHLVIFSTEVVDLTPEVTDPVEVLMRVQLGGGTDINKAVEYARELVETPRRSIVAIISDFFEGGDSRQLVRNVRGLVEQGTRVLGLASLDPEAVPCYDRDMATQLVEAGAEVAAMTPGELASWVAEVVG